jgi:hypothetical protein
VVLNRAARSRNSSPGSSSRAGRLLNALVRDAEQVGDVPDRQTEPLAKLPHGRGDALLGFGLDGFELGPSCRSACHAIGSMGLPNRRTFWGYSPDLGLQVYSPAR